MAKAIIRAWVVTAVGVALLATAESASAGTAAVTPAGFPHYDAAPGEQNVLVVTYVPTVYRFEDQAGVIAGQGCQSLGPTVATCSTNAEVLIKLGDLDDSVQVGDRACDCQGGEGADTLKGGSEGDYLQGQKGADVVQGGAGGDTINGGHGGDTLNGEGDPDYLYAGAGNDHDILDGGSNADFIIAEGTGSLGDELIGGGGDDQLEGGAPASDVLRGGVGDDRATAGPGDVVQGDDGNDTFHGGHDVSGGPGDDVLWAGGFSVQDRLDGGPGTDIAVYSRPAGATVSVTLDGNANDGEASEQDNVLATENLRGDTETDRFTGNSAANQIFGGVGADRLNGKGGDDALFGEGGNDSLIGGNNADLLDGGDDVDTAEYSDHTTAITASLDGVANDGTTDVDCATGACPGPPGDNAVTENLVGGRGDDELTGDDGPNALVGNLGADTLLGLDGNDDLLARDNVADLLLDCDGGHDIARFDTFLDPEPIDCETLNPRH